MELITGFERGLLIGQEVQPIVTTVLRVQRPKSGDLESFRKRLLKEFKKYPRCYSRRVKIGHSYFFQVVKGE